MEVAPRYKMLTLLRLLTLFTLNALFALHTLHDADSSLGNRQKKN